MASFYDVREFSDIREMIDQSVELFPDRNAFEIKRANEHFNITYKEYYEDINGLVTALVNDGFDGNSIAVCANNCYEYCLSYLAVICSGNVIVPVDKELHEEDIIGILRTSKSKILICDSFFTDRIDISKLGDIRVMTIDCDLTANGAEKFADYVAKGKELNASGKTLWRDVKQDPDRLCTLLFTSGTTGTSKGVMLCQNNFVFEIQAAMKVVKIYPEDCGISMLPLHHTFESSIIIFFAVYCGAKVTFCEGFKYVLRNMAEFSPSVFVAVPLLLETVHKRLMKAVAKKSHGIMKFRIGSAVGKAAGKFGIDLKKVLFKEIQDTFGGNMRLIICGGAPIDPQIIKDFDAFGIQVIFGYGLTECAPLAIINNDFVRSTDSIGVPLPGVEAKIIDVDENGIGELCVKGGMVMKGYYENPEATAEVIDEDGFFHTGDLGYVDDKGHYHITGRSKNVIVTSNGKNIYPEELEYHLCRSDFIASALVEGKVDDHGDLTVHAQIYPDKSEIKEFLDKEPSDDEVRAIVKRAIEEVNKKIPPFKKIKSFYVRTTEFVMTTTQKIKRSDSGNKEEKDD